jgi:PKHD-type hydroxylase
MFLVISDVLTEAEVSAARAHLLQSASFTSGKPTAGHHARDVKDNEQAIPESVNPVLKKIEQALLANRVFKAAASPKSIIKLMVSRYSKGMHYGTHVDDPIMAGIRTDLSFTLFLNDPDAYEGGSLVIEENDADRAFKLNAGSLVLYPTTSLHHVAEVTAGERLAVVGWVRSYLRDSAKRELIFDLENIIAASRSDQAARPVLDRLYKIRANLLRMWIED